MRRRTVVKPPPKPARPSLRSRRRAKRRHCRIAVHLDLRLEIPGGQKTTATALDVSIGGMFIACNEPMAINTPVRIICALSVKDRPMELLATVRWTTSSGFGAQLGLLGARETHAIAELIRGARASQMPPRTPDPVERAPTSLAIG